MNEASILYVEDEEDYQLLVHRILTKAGLRVRTAESGEQGLAMLDRGKPDLLILDINLPDTDGYTLCSRLRQDPAWSRLPILMLTVRRRPEEWLQGFSSGADDYLPKPLNPPELVDRVQSCLTNRREATAGESDTGLNLRNAEYLLTRAVVSGNRTAFEALVRKYRERLIESLRIAGCREADAEDCVASALAKAYGCLVQFQGKSSFYTWLYRIAANEAHRPPRFGSGVSLEGLTRGDDSRLPVSLAEPDTLGKGFSRRVQQAQLKQAVACVPRPYRQMLVARFVHGRSCRAMAKRLGIPRGTVMSRLFKAKRLLKEAWAATCNNP